MNNGPAVAPVAGVSRTRYAFLLSPAYIVSVGLIARVGCIVALGLYQLDVRYWTKFEMVVIGHSLAVGQGFSAPWGDPAGQPLGQHHSICCWFP
jgi:hypothetical protein